MFKAAIAKQERVITAFSGMEWIIVAIVVIMLFFGGAKKIPEFAQSIGRARGEYERGRLQVEKEIAAERAKPATAAASGALWTCAKCGAQAGADAGFCPKCGSAKPAAV